MPASLVYILDCGCSPSVVVEALCESIEVSTTDVFVGSGPEDTLDRGSEKVLCFINAVKGDFTTCLEIYFDEFWEHLADTGIVHGEYELLMELCTRLSCRGILTAFTLDPDAWILVNPPRPPCHVYIKNEEPDTYIIAQLEENLTEEELVAIRLKHG